MNKLLALLLLLSPFFLFVAFFIFLEDGTPVFFTQKRVGINYTFFQMYKFRSMKKNTPNVAIDFLENQQFLPYLKGKLESNNPI